MPLLTRSTVDSLDPARRPLIDPGDLKPHMVHFGLGAFHRAHQAVYTEAAAARSGTPWGITAVAPRSAETVAAMRAQDCLYTVTDRAPGPPKTRVVGSIVDALRMRADRERIGELLGSPDVTVVTVTITEKAHYRRSGTGALDTRAPEVAADLAATGVPDPEFGTVVGMLAGCLATRFRRDGAPISVVSCDNMTANGDALGLVVRRFVEASQWKDRDAVLDWLSTSVAFPATIVDRIVPATTTEDQQTVSAALGLRDAVPVVGEPYRQWVLEDRFAAPRPPWELDDALFVPDVTPYQVRKLRLLNGAHSALAYLGAAAGHDTVADVLDTGWGERFVRGFGAEAGATLAGPTLSGATADYVGQVVERFRNPAMRHRLRQIGSDGSVKIPERWFGALRERRSAGLASPLLELSLAAWVNVIDADGLRFGMTDPLADALAGCRTGFGPAESVARLLRLTGAPDLAEQADLTTSVARQLPALRAGRIEF